MQTSDHVAGMGADFPRDTTVRMLGYNGSVPGPTLKVAQGSEIVVQVTNQGDLDTTVHRHGLRLVRTGQAVDSLFDVTNPGLRMARCHIAEQMQSGMMFSFNVAREGARP